MNEEKATWDDTAETASKSEPKAEAPQPEAEGVAAGTGEADFSGAPIEDGGLVLDETRPFGRMQNCPGAHYVQDGKLFGVDKRFIGTQQEIQ